MSNLSRRYERALERDTVSVSIRQDRNRKIFRKVLETGDGNSITDRVVSVLEKGLEAESRKDRTYREDKPEKSNYKDFLQEDSNMQKDELRQLIEDNYDVGDKDLESKSQAYLEGYLSTRIDMGIQEISDANFDYLKGIVEANNGKVSMTDLGLREDQKQKASRVDDLKKKRLEIGEKSDLSESLQKRVDKGELSEVEALRIQRKNVGEEVEDKDVDEIRADRIEKFQQGDE